MSTGALHRIHSRSEESPILGSTCTRTHHLADRFLYGEHGPVMGCWLSTRWLPPLRPTSTLGMYSRRRQACFVHGYLHSRATHLGGYGTPVLYSQGSRPSAQVPRPASRQGLVMTVNSMNDPESNQRQRAIHAFKNTNFRVGSRLQGESRTKYSKPSSSNFRDLQLLST